MAGLTVIVLAGARKALAETDLSSDVPLFSNMNLSNAARLGSTGCRRRASEVTGVNPAAGLLKLR